MKYFIEISLLKKKKIYYFFKKLFQQFFIIFHFVSPLHDLNFFTCYLVFTYVNKLF